jgi:2-C-methyl-D-erythritol 2,4-cyclodiphosphate synthase
VNPRIGTGLDIHAFADDDRPLVLAGVTIPDAPGLAGHSDADVVAHAVTDAVLGAIGAGDLGSRFGVDTPALVGADSMRLLAEAVADLHRDGWHVGNTDVVVVAQRPRLGPHRDAMRARLAEVLAVQPGDVSMKATTTDRLGALGRGEGIACWATVLVLAP